MAENLIKLKPQEGKQTEFLSTPADIAFYGGSAGSGKTYALLLETYRNYFNPKFSTVIFRRTTPEIKMPGGLWDEANKLYRPITNDFNQSSLEIKIPDGAKIKFSHLEHEHDIYNWQGAQVPLIMFDEVTHFTEKQFFYMLSRNRSDSGISGYIRASCNPDPDSWVRTFLDWWIGEDGYPIEERSGVIRWFKREHNNFIWSDIKEDDDFKSVTFIPALIDDNKILLDNDPSYLSSLKALSYVDRMRLLHGNWNVRESAGLFFRKEWFEVVDAIPSDTESVRYWDRAASEKDTADYTVGLKMHKDKNNVFYISDVIRFRGNPLKVEESVLNIAKQDSIKTEIGIEQDPGQAGVSEANAYVRLLSGFIVKLNKVTTNKEIRAKPLSAQCERGNVKILRGKWNQDFLNELESFPESSHDDQVDAASGAFNYLTSKNIGVFTKDMARSKIGTIIGSRRTGDQW